MILKTSETQINKITQEVFLKIWYRENPKKFKNENLKCKLQVPIYLKGKKTNIIVDSKLILNGTQQGISLKIFSNFNKIIVFSLLIGCIPSLLFLVLFSSISYFISSSLFISVFIFYMYYLKIKTVSKKYVVKIKTRFLIAAQLES